ncbi:MAG: PAS domain S-box protein [Candidatus Heimdallarchaeum aukensis]|uniref:histidine kinase n=1 Tax=Candidatus Heimdallarchaeum aukensis TaxID=2876573 RepID=A0A9Y1BM46_9ARCH|nr:MAG: PAS domain S-box protein [Candidatus Heimdallarchaeum aukensis]
MSNLFSNDVSSNKKNKNTENESARVDGLKLKYEDILSCFDSLEEAIFVFNNNLSILYINKRAEDLIGVKKSIILEKKINEYFEEKDKEKNLEYYLKLSDSKKSFFTFVTFLLAKEGKRLPVKLKVIFNSSNDCHVAVASSFSSKLDEIMELEFNKNILREVIDQVPQMIFVKNEEGRFLLANKALADRFNLPISEIEGSIQHDIQPVKSETDYFLKYDRKVIDTKSRIKTTSSFTDAFGEKRTIEVRKIPIKLPSGEIAALGVATDITKHVEREKELKETSSELSMIVERKNEELLEEKLKLEAIFETVSPGLLLIDDEGNFSLFNKKFEEFYRVLYPEDKEPLLSLNIFSEKFKDDPLFSFIKELIIEKEKVCDTFELSENFFIQVSGVNITSSGSFIGALIEFQDITPFLTLDKLRKNFISSVSHELRTPITSISLSIQFLKKYWERLPKRKIFSTLEVMEESADLLTTLIEDLLVVSKIENNRFKVEKKKFNIIRNINSTIRSFEEQLKSKKIRLEKKFETKDIQYFGDPKRIKQIISNVLDNAIKYSLSNSKIEVTVIKDYVGEYNPDNRKGLLIQIQDHGIGIPSHDLPYVFKPFFRTDEAEKSEGTGLGLYITKNLVELHDGQIFIDSIHHVGTKVSIFLPFIEF